MMRVLGVMTCFAPLTAHVLNSIGHPINRAGGKTQHMIYCCLMNVSRGGRVGRRGGEREVLRWRNLDGWRRVRGGELGEGGRVGEA